MKTQIKRFSPLQNAKVLSILMAVTSLVFIIPMLLIMAATLPNVDQAGNSMTPPFAVIIFFPILYLVITYIAVVLGSIIYNFIAKFVGGLEYETEEQDV